MTKLASTLPKALEDDGLSSLNRRLVQNPKHQHLVVAVVDCKKVETETDDGATIATARVVQIEPIYNEADQDLVQLILRRASDTRNGRLPLPGIDLTTGEVR